MWYEKEFKRAHVNGRKFFGPEVTPPFRLRKQVEHHDPNVLIEAVAKDFLDGVLTSSRALPGKCFSMIREASYVLNSMQVRNYITVGDVHIDGVPYFGVTLEDLEDESEKGYRPNTPITGHAWLTLDSGQVFDATILASVNEKKKGTELPLKEALYVGKPYPKSKISHRPLLAGFGYHLGPVSGYPSDQHFKIHRQWHLDYMSVFHPEGA